MSTSSKVSLGSLRLQSQERSDNENNGAISTEAWNAFITNSYKELYDMLTSAYGNDYYVANTYQFTTTAAQSYALPDGTSSFTDTTGSTAAKFYKLLGVDLQYSASPSGWVPLKRFDFIDRNKFQVPNTQINYLAFSNLRYRVQGDNLYVTPVPSTGQTVQLWYAPAPTNLQFRLPTVTTLSSQTLGLLDTTGLSVGMNVSGTGIADSTTISSVGSTSVGISSAATSTNPSSIVSFWSDSTLIEGISGWEEYVIVDAAIKAQGKQESDTSELHLAKAELKARIEAMAEGRDIGQAFHTSDVIGNFSYDYSSGSDGGWY